MSTVEPIAIDTPTAPGCGRALWSRLVEPAPSIPVEARRQARLLSALLLVLIGSVLVGMLVARRLVPLAPVLMVPAAVVLGTAYWLSRTPNFRLGLALTIAVQLLLPMGMFIMAGEARQYVYASVWGILGVILSSLFFSARGTAFVALLTLVGLGLLPVLVPGVTRSDIPLVMLFTTSTSLTVLVAAVHRNRLEADRVAQLQAGTRRLEAELVQRDRAESEARHQAIRAETLVRIAARLNAQLDLASVLTPLSEEAAQALNVPAALLHLYDPRRELLVYAGGVGVSPEAAAGLRPIPRAAYEALHADPAAVLVIPDVSTSALPDADRLAARDVRTVVSARMNRQGQLVGTLSVATRGEVREFTPDELQLLQGLADQGALAITNGRFLDEAQRRLKQVQALRNIDMAITASLDLRLTLSVLLDQVISQLDVDASAVLLLNRSSQVLEYAAGSGFRTPAISRTRLRLGEQHAGQAALARRIVHVPNIQRAEGGFGRASLLAGEDFVTYYAVPLIAKARVNGVLEIFHRQPLETDSEWSSFLEALAGQAAIAIDNATLFNDLERSNVDLALAYEATLEGWSRALDLRDKETEGHTQRVTDLTLRLARVLAMPEAELAHVRRGALLHDIGKMGIPDSILLKPGSLTDDEWQIMRQHPTYAYELLYPISYLRPALDIPYCHHEKWNGSGYPRGLKAEQIPLAARIFAVIDVWDALRSDRPYRLAWPEERVRAHIAQGAGTHFEPRLVEVFLGRMGELVRPGSPT